MNRVTITIAALALLVLGVTGLQAQDMVTFQLDMQFEVAAGLFDPAADELQIAGSQNGWAAPSGDVLLDGDADLVYEETFDLTGNDSPIFYKYIQVDPDMNVDWENDPNREVELTGAPQTVDDECWNFHQSGQCGTPVENSVRFRVNMEAFTTLGIFTPATANDTMQVRGSFNGWGDADPDNAVMDLEFGSDFDYSLDATVLEIPGNNIFYKFFPKLDPDAHGELDGWEEPLSKGGGNRTIEFANDAAQETFDHYFMDINPEGLTTGTITVTMSVDMAPALEDPIAPFDPDNHNVYLGLYDQFFADLNGGRDVGAQEDLVYEDMGNNIYELTFDMAPSYYGILYRISYGTSVDELTFEEGGSFDFGNKRARFIEPDMGGGFPDEYVFPMDVIDFEEPLLVQSPPLWPYVGIDDENSEFPIDFGLEQNYPNPFNPETTIEYHVSSNVRVAVEIFNVIGEKVRTLYAGQAAPGTHRLVWDGTDNGGNQVSSGLYIYKLSLGDKRVDSKQMLLIR